MAHAASACPLAAVMAVRSTTRIVRLVALALAVSVVPDVLSYFLGGTWQMMHVYPVVQLSLLIVALSSRKIFRIVAVGGIVVAAVLSAIQGPLDFPEVVISVGGPLFVCLLVWPKSELGRVRTALLVYFGLGSVFLATFPLFFSNLSVFLIVWLGYQACRMAGLGLMVSHVLQRQPERNLSLVRA